MPGKKCQSTLSKIKRDMEEKGARNYISREPKMYLSMYSEKRDGKPSVSIGQKKIYHMIY